MYEKWKADWKEEGIRQYEIAAAIGVAPSTLSRWLRECSDYPSWLTETLEKAEERILEYHEELRADLEDYLDGYEGVTREYMKQIWEERHGIRIE